jgi:hypothetical protein
MLKQYETKLGIMWKILKIEIMHFGLINVRFKVAPNHLKGIQHSLMTDPWLAAIFIPLHA